ncbi:MAG: trehalase-like domain-containing protein, partial [Acidimicrobiales bacterium]
MRTELGRILTDIAENVVGAVVEQKPASVAFHYRNAPDASEVEAALEEIYRGPGAMAGVHTRRSSFVLELSVIETNKGAALDTLRRRVGASAVLFLGDDTSDEDALLTLMGPDVGVKVGVEDSVAPFRVGGPDEVAHLLAELVQLREQWLTGAGVVPVEQHTVLSDLRTLAVLTPSAQITWMCVPRIDSAALFADLVGGPSAGYFSICPVDGSPPTRQRYLDGTMTVETLYPTFALCDYMDVSNGRWEEVAGRSDLVRVLEGSGGVRIEFAPRVDFGRVATRIEVVADGLQVVGTSEQVMLYAPGIVWELIEDGEHHTAVAEIQLNGTPTVLELLTGIDNADDRLPEEPRRDQTGGFWSQWAENLTLPEVATDQVRRSALLLKSLTHAPTGAIVAAGTSSLPEHMGGVRNWDYRYCWLRDAAWSVQALASLGAINEGLQFLDWLMEIVDRRGTPARLQPLYNVAGRHLPPEADLSDLAGYAGSRPVRVGNAAEGQVQLDVFGPIVDLVASLQAAGATISQRHFGLVEASVSAVEARWREPDHGIWEERTRPRHH